MKSKKVTPQLDSESLYLQQLTFDEKMRGKWIEVLFRNARLLILAIIGIVVFGWYVFSSLPRELNPEVQIPAVNVVTVLPGAAPRDVEELVSKKIENAASNLPNIDIVTSSSTQGVSVVSFQFVSSQDLSEALRLTQEEINQLKDELPEDALDPVVSKIDVNDQAFLSIAVTGDTDLVSLSHVGKELQEELERTSGIRRVDISGSEEEHIAVVLDKDALQRYSISDQSVLQALKANNLSLPSGEIEVNGLEYTLSVDSDLDTVEKLQSLPVSVGDQVVRLGEVADIYLRSKESFTYHRYTKKGESEKPAIRLAIFKAEDETITAAAEKSKAVIDRVIAEHPYVKVVEVENFSKEITDTFGDLQSNFIQSIGLMFLVLLVFLGLRQASIAAMTIPLVILCAIIAMKLMGLTLNFLSLFSLLLALSLIGDDAIVMAEATTSYNKKFGAIETGLMVFRDFFIPIWVGTITVVWSFIPLLMTSGIIGEFIKPIPLVVTATLLSSTAIATLINLPLNIILIHSTIPRRVKVFALVLLGIAWVVALTQVAAHTPVLWFIVVLGILVPLVGWRTRQSLRRSIMGGLHYLNNHVPRLVSAITFLKNRLTSNAHLLTIDPLAEKYHRAIRRVIGKPRYRRFVYATIISLLVISGTFMATGLLKNEFFPASDNELFYVNIEGPAGSTIEQTQSVMVKVNDILATVPEIDELHSSTNTTISGDFGGGGSGHNKAMFTVLLDDMENRERTSIEIVSALRKEFETISEAEVSILEVSGGPPAGAAFQVNIKGESLEELEKIANDFQGLLRDIPGAVTVDSSLKLSTGQITVRLKYQELAERGLTAAQVGGWLRTNMSGSDVGTIIMDGEDRDITILTDESLQDISLLRNTRLPSQMGGYTLNEVADLTLENSPVAIVREDGKRVVRVTSGIEGTTSPELLKAFQAKADQYQMPEGYSWDVGGVNEENQKSVNSIIQAMGISFFLILVTMVLQLRSFRKAAMVVAVIPLALIGVFINFTIFSIPLSFPALIGVLSLFGIVVNNALMVMDKINLNLEHDFELEDAVVDGAASRVEAIFLSSLSAVAGLLPVTLSDPLWQGLGGAIIAGLSVSGFLILFLLPSLYIEIFAPRSKRSK